MTHPEVSLNLEYRAELLVNAGQFDSHSSLEGPSQSNNLEGSMQGCNKYPSIRESVLFLFSQLVIFCLCLLCFSKGKGSSFTQRQYVSVKEIWMQIKALVLIQWEEPHGI